MQTIKVTILVLIMGLTTYAKAATEQDQAQVQAESTATPAPESWDPQSNKGSRENCHPADEAKKYQQLVGKNVMVNMLWKKTSPSQESLQFPMTVKAITDEGLEVSIREFSLKAHYVPLFYNSGHLLARDGATVLDICAAELTVENEDKPYIEFHR